MTQVKWHNSDRRLENCSIPCQSCGQRCINNGGMGEDPPVNGHSNIHMYTDSPAYVNQDLECRVSGGQSAFIGVYLKNGGELVSFMVRNTIYNIVLSLHQPKNKSSQVFCSLYLYTKP